MARRVLVSLSVLTVVLAAVIGLGWSRHQVRQQAGDRKAACYDVLGEVFVKATTDKTPNAPTVDGPPKECQGLSRQELSAVSTEALQEGFRRGSKILDQRHPLPLPSNP